MNNIIKIFFKYIILFVSFGGLYFIIESLYKGHITDYRMFIMAGIIGILIGLVNNLFSFETNFILQCLFGTLIALLGECICGYQWNIVQNLGLWDYSSLPFSFANNQINLFFGFAWLILSAVCIVLDDFLRWKLFNEEFPHYTLKGVC